jgi:hypothetical protein
MVIGVLRTSSSQRISHVLEQGRKALKTQQSGLKNGCGQNKPAAVDTKNDQKPAG